MLGPDQLQELVVEVEDVSAQLGGVELPVLAGQPCFDLRRNPRSANTRG
jgi:hypothetical protein